MITTVILLGTTHPGATVGASFDRLVYTVIGSALALAAIANMSRLPDPTRTPTGELRRLEGGARPVAEVDGPGPGE